MRLPERDCITKNDILLKHRMCKKKMPSNMQDISSDNKTIKSRCKSITKQVKVIQTTIILTGTGTILFSLLPTSPSRGDSSVISKEYNQSSPLVEFSPG